MKGVALPLELDRAIPLWRKMAHHDVGFAINMLNTIWETPGHAIKLPMDSLTWLYNRTKNDPRSQVRAMHALCFGFWWHPKDEVLHSAYVYELVGDPQQRMPVPRWMKSEVRGAALQCGQDQDWFECHYCGCDASEDYHFDHALPVARGGINHPFNLRLACPTCNFSKGIRTEHEFGWWDSISKSRIHSIREVVGNG